MDGNSTVRLELRLIISLFLGGVVYAKAEYMAVFGMAIGLNLVDILMRLIMMEKLTAAKYKPAEDVTSKRSGVPSRGKIKMESTRLIEHATFTC